jgi:cytochrome c-type biogenesis protein CcmH/NrfG
MLTRVLVALLAIAAIVWLGIGYRSTVLGERGERLAGRPDQTPAHVRDVERTLERARFLNPDTRPLLAEGVLLAAHGRYDEGVDLLEQSVRREPDNVVAWGVLAEATARRDPARSRDARAEVRRLSPPVDGDR